METQNKKKKSGVVLGVLFAIVALFWGMYILTLCAGNRDGDGERRNVQKNRSPVISQEDEQQTTSQVAPSEVTVYKDTKYGFSFEVPKSFVQEKTNDGVYAYTLYFTSKPIKGDYNRLMKGDVQLQVQVSKEKVNKNAFQEAILGLRDAHMTVTLQDATATIAGVTAESLIATSSNRSNSEGLSCSKQTYFTQNNVNYEIVLTSPDACEGVTTFNNAYEQVLSSFRFKE